MPDDDQLPQHEQDNIPPRSCTPPTPPVEADQPSPPPLPPPVRARAMGQLRPVSIPDMVSNMAGRNPIRVLADFDRHYMPHDDQPMHDSACIEYMGAEQGESYSMFMMFFHIICIIYIICIIFLFFIFEC